jgi:hypothetical protein
VSSPVVRMLFSGLQFVILGENYIDIRQGLLLGPVSSTVLRIVLRVYNV